MANKRTETIASVRSVKGAPIWLLKPVFAVDPAMHRMLAINEQNVDQLLLHWRATKGNVQLKSFSILGKDVQHSDEGDTDRKVMLVDAVLARDQKSLGERLHLLGQGEIGFSVQKAKLQNVLNLEFASAGSNERFTNLRLHPEGLIVEVELEAADRRAQLMLTSNPAGELCWCWLDTPPMSSRRARLLRAVENIRAANSPAQWVSWRWTSAPHRFVAFAAGKSGSKWILEINKLLIDSSALTLVLRDEKPQSTLTALSRHDLTVDKLTLSFDASDTPTQLVIGLGAGKESADEELSYQYSNTTESFNAKNLEFEVEPDIQRRLSESHLPQIVERAFLPVSQGWLMLDLPSVGVKQPANVPADLGASITLAGGWTVGTRRLERDDDRAEQNKMPWSIRMDSCTALRFECTLSKELVVTQITGSISDPALALRGLFWLAASRPGDDDLLPQMELGNRWLRDPVLLSPARKETWPWRIKISDLKIAGASTWPSLGFKSAELSGLVDPLVLWTRHQSQPSIQVMPLTSARAVPVRALASRELLPIKISASTIQLHSNATWPTATSSAHVHFWWPTEAPSSGKNDWAEYPDHKNAVLTNGIGLASLAMAGTEFWPSKTLNKFNFSYRTDLPWSDERFALASLPDSDGLTSKQEHIVVWPDLAFAELAELQQFWLNRHDAWMLSLSRHTVLVDRKGVFDVYNLLPGLEWLGGGAEVRQNVDLNATQIQLGSLDVQLNGGEQQALADEALLQGLDALLEVNSASRQLTLKSEPGAPQMVGFAPPLLNSDDFAIDGDGTGIKATNPWRRVVRVGSVEFSCVTLNKEVELPWFGARKVSFWCRELPCNAEGRFKPSAATRSHPLSGYEWRLFDAGDNAKLSIETRLPINDWLCVEPLRLDEASFNADWSLKEVALSGAVFHEEQCLGELKVRLTSTTARVEGTPTLRWFLPPILLQDGWHLDARPHIKFEFDGAVIAGSSKLHLPVLGLWREIPLVQESSGKWNTWNISSKDFGEVICPTGQIRVGERETEVDLTMLITCDAFHIRLSRKITNDAPKKSIQHLLTPIDGRFVVPVTDRQIDHFDLLCDHGFGLAIELSIPGSFSPLLGLKFANTTQRWLFGLAFGGGDQIQITQAWIEGTVVQNSIEVFETLIRSNRSKDGGLIFSHETRLVGDWKTTSVIAWPTPSYPHAGNLSGPTTVDWNWTSAKHSSMTVHFAGQTLRGSGFNIGDDGEYGMPIDGDTEVKATHLIGGKTFVGLHQMGVLSLANWLSGLNVIAGKSFEPSFVSGKEKLEASADGFLAPTFRTAMANLFPQWKDTMVVVATPLWVIDGRPLAFAHLGLLVEDLSLSARINVALRPSSSSTENVAVFDIEINQIAVESQTERTVQIKEIDATRDLYGFWQRKGASRLTAKVFDSDWLTLHDFTIAGNGHRRDMPALGRSILHLKQILLAQSEPKNVYSVGVVDGLPVLIDAKRLRFESPAQSAFAEAPASEDLLVAGGGQLLIRTNNESSSDPRWLHEFIESSLGEPEFAIRRGSAAIEVLALARGLIRPLSAGERGAMSVDVNRGPFRSPLQEKTSGVLLSKIAASRLLDRRPLRLGAMHTTGTRQQWQTLRAAGGDVNFQTWQQSRVMFAAPRPTSRVMQDRLPDWPAWSVKDSSSGPTGAQTYSAPLRELVSFAERAGAMRVYRQATVIEHKADAEVGLSTAHAYRSPRPMALPASRQSRSLLVADQPDGWQRLDAIDGLADVAWLPRKLFDPAVTAPDWRPVLFILVSPRLGRVGPNFSMRFELSYKIHDTNPALPVPIYVPLKWRAYLSVSGRSIALTVDLIPNKGNVDEGTLFLRVSEALPEFDRDEVEAELVVIAAPDSTSGLLLEPAISMQFPLLLVSGKRFQLPVVAHTLLFFDPLFNQTMGGQVAKVGDETLWLVTDRQTYNVSSPMVLMCSIETACTFRRGRRLPSGEIQFQPIRYPDTPSPLKLPAKTAVRFELSAFISDESGQPATLLPGDLLQVSAEGKDLLLTLNIAAQPVLSPPESAYALWQSLTANQIRCALYGYGVMPDRVVLLDANTDLQEGRVRRFALFKWQVVLASTEATSARYFLQRLDAHGATHFPKSLGDFNKPLGFLSESKIKIDQPLAQGEKS